jgi:Ca-activated chloride channel family protein
MTWKVPRHSLLLPLLLPAVLLPAQDAHVYLRKGDKAYVDGDFAAAETNYRKALEKEQARSGEYNLGNSTYRQGRFEEAARHFESAAEQTTDPVAKAKAYHNLGNALYRQGNFAASAEAYKNSLRLQPHDPETGRNLVNALRKLPPPSQQQPDNTSDDPRDNPEQNPSANQDDATPPPPPQEPSDAPQQPGPSGSQEASAQDAINSGQEAQLRPEEARQLLDIMSQEEKRVQQKFQKANTRGSKPTKDW